MEESILNSTKKILGLDESYEAFDLDIITHINAAFFILSQLGVGPTNGFMIEGSDEEWGGFVSDNNNIHLVKTYIFLKVRMLFDPPTTSFLIDAYKQQLEQYEWRLSISHESEVNT